MSGPLDVLDIRLSYNAIFFMADHNLVIKNFADCRDTLQAHAPSVLLSKDAVYLGVRTIRDTFIQEYFENLEKILHKKPCKLYGTAASKNFVFIKLDDFWKQPLRFSFLTAFLKRIRLRKNTDIINPYDLAGGRYFSNREAIKMFLDGCHHIGTFCPTEGWSNHFKIRQNTHKILSSKPFEKFGPINIGHIVYDMVPDGYKKTTHNGCGYIDHYYNLKGNLHREDGPAIVNQQNNVFCYWYNDGQHISNKK